MLKTPCSTDLRNATTTHVSAAFVNGQLQNLRERGPGVKRPNDRRDTMHRVPLPSAAGPYVLATGEAAAYRLRILHSLYGPGTRRVLLEAGLQRGMRVADVGCGVGMVTTLLAEFVGAEGHVVGIDASAAQLDQARERLNTSGVNASFVQASATGTGLPPESFDLVYCRFLLLHLPKPEEALREMRALLKPNGILVCGVNRRCCWLSRKRCGFSCERRI
jgi:2-polyprenyl-3-methyl-5-hydroxy-6-metoxy-1,4-benzoquinol methylase